MLVVRVRLTARATYSVLAATTCTTSVTYSRLEMRVSVSMAFSLSFATICFSLREKMAQ